MVGTETAGAVMSSTELAEEAIEGESTSPDRTWQRWIVALVWLVLGAAWFTVVTVTGSPWLDVVRWLGAAIAGVLLPGVALVRAVRRASAPLIEDLAWGAVAGCLPAMIGWLLDAVLPWAVPPWVFGPSLVALLCIAPPTRRRITARPAPGWRPGPHLAVVASLGVALAWMVHDYLRLFPADPGLAGRRYYPDTLFQLAVVGELRHSASATYPLVSGDPFAYHWFGHAVLAHLLTGTGVDPFDLVFRLAPATLLPVVVILAAVVARRVAGLETAGGVAACLLTVTGTTVATFWSNDGSSLPTIQMYWWSSLTTAFGWLATLGCVGCVVAVIRRGTADDAVPSALLLPLLLLAAGAKSADDAVLAGGTVLAAVAALFLRRRRVPAVLVCLVTTAVLASARFTLYAGTGYGLRLEPGSVMVGLAHSLFPGLGVAPRSSMYLALPAMPVWTVAVAATVWFLPLVPRLVGLAPLAALGRDATSWFLIGTMACGFGASLAFRQPGSSQAFFLIAAYPVGVVGSAAGLAVLAHRRRTSWKAPLIGALVGVGATVAAAWWAGPDSPTKLWIAAHGFVPLPSDVVSSTQAWWVLGPLTLLAAVLLGAALIAWLVRGFGHRRSVVVGSLAMLVATGALSTGLYVTGAARSRATSVVQAEGSPETVTPDYLAVGRWLDANAGPHDVLATNHVCTQMGTRLPLPAVCTAKEFILAAVAQRTVDVGGWAFAPRNLDAAWSSTVAYANQPFWDPGRLAQEQDAFVHPSAALLDDLWVERGVRWLVADDRGLVPQTALLDQLAIRRVSLPTITVWQLRRPR